MSNMNISGTNVNEEEKMNMNNIKNTVAANVNKKENVKMNNKKIDSKVMHIIKSENIYKVTHTENGYTLDPEATGDSFAVGIASANPLSVRFSRTRVSTGMLDQHLPKDYTSSARIDKSTGVTSLVS